MKERKTETGTASNIAQNSLWECFCAILQIEGITLPAEKGAACQAGAVDFAGMQRSAKKAGLRVRLVKPSLEELAGFEEPLLGRLKEGGYIVIGKSNGRVLLVFDPATGKTQTYKAEDFLAAWSGECLWIKRKFSLKAASQKFNLLWFVSVIFEYRKYFFDVLLASFFLQLFGLVTPLFTQVIIDKVILHKGIATLDVLAGALLAAALFQCMMSIARKYIETHTTNKIDMILGTRLFRHLLSLPLRYFEVRRVGDTLTRVSALNSIRGFLTGSSLTAFLDAFFSIVFFAVMFYYSVFLTCIALLPLPFYLLQNILVTPVYKKRLEEVWRSGARSNAFLVEAVTGVQTMKALAVEPQFNHQWEKVLAQYVHDTFNNAKLGIGINASSNIIQNIMIFGILLAGGHAVMNGEMTIGQLIAFQMLSRQAGEPLHRLSGLWQTCQQTILAVERLGDILNTAPEISQLHEQKLQQLTGKIEFQQVSFSYNAETVPNIRDMSFVIEPGMRVGIVGRSGSGKSTLTKLVERLYIPGSGHIYIDGEDILDIQPVWLRQQVGVVLQENFLFHGSIRDNIAFGRPAASIQEVIQAAQLAGAHEFILELADGYDTVVGERGDSLSGGQQQRIAIARALLMNPRILIFDEATSALDYESENIIMGNIDRIAAGRTMLFIAHRLSTVRNCDRILVVEKGALAEWGTHAELMAKQGIYFHLYQQQEG